MWSEHGGLCYIPTAERDKWLGMSCISNGSLELEYGVPAADSSLGCISKAGGSQSQSGI